MSEWSDWIEHDGMGCPCVGKYAQWVFSSEVPHHVGFVDRHGCILVDQRTSEGIARNGNSWCSSKGYISIIRYRIRKPKGLTILEQILNDLPAPTKPTVPA